MRHFYTMSSPYSILFNTLVQYNINQMRIVYYDYDGFTVHAYKGTVRYCRLYHTLLPAQRKGCAMVTLSSMACTVKSTVKSNIILHPPPKKNQ